MLLIFYFSSLPKGSPVLEGFPAPPGLGHFIGYGLLGLLLYRALNKGWKGWSVKAAKYSFVIGLIYAISDEFHQYFVPGREAALSDVLIDAAGLAATLMVIRLSHFLIKV